MRRYAVFNRYHRQAFPGLIMPYDPRIHHRRSIRLPGYDYRQPGAYFITLVAQDRTFLFGYVKDG
jgi:putative transposase